MCCDSSPARAGPPERRGRALAVFDLDGTLSRHDTLAPFLLACLGRRPWRWPRLLLALPAAIRYLFEPDRGALKGALLHAALGGLDREVLQAAAARFVDRLVRGGIYRDARRALEAHRSRGERLLLLSASTDLYVPQIARRLGFDVCICSQVAWRADGRLDGRLAAPNCRGEEKRRRLAELMEQETPARVYAYGNSAADLAHLALAQEAYLVNGPRRLSQAAAAHVQRLRWRD